METIYRGAFARAVRNLKIFSVGSLAMCTAVSPAILLLQSPLPTVAKVAIVGTALSASGLSTYAIQYFLGPYVLEAGRIRGNGELSLVHYNWMAQRKRSVVPIANVQRLTGEGMKSFCNMYDGKIWWFVHDDFWQGINHQAKNQEKNPAALDQV